MYDEKELKQFDRWGKQRPSHDEHGSIEDIRANMKKAQCSNWRMEGNVLYADTDFGPLVQTLPTNVICKGTDAEGMPILVKLSL